jgi:putative FmdB family regulatory protein
MPIYEYECGECCHTFERRQRFDEEPVAMCPRCGGKCRRVIHASPIIFKGSGFYATSNRQPSWTEGAADKMPARGAPADKMMEHLSAVERKRASAKKGE